MIVRPRPNFFQLFYVMRGSIVPRILPQVIGLALFSALIVEIVQYLEISMESFTLTPFGLLGVALSIFLGFRNNAAYDRWWEARKLWGHLIYDIRNLGRAAGTLIADTAERRALMMDTLAFVHLLRGTLRGIDASADARKFVGAEVDDALSASNPPDALIRKMGARIGHQHKQGEVDSIGFRILDERLSDLAATQAGCERIGGTPLPFAYQLLVHRTAYLFCILLPIGLVSTAGWATPFFTALVAYTFFGLDALSEELDDPFGTEANDLALDAMCRVCEISVFESLGETPPPPLPASHFYLS